MNRNEIAVTAAAGIVLSGVQGIAPLLPTMQDAFGVGHTQISLVVLAYVLAATIVAFPVSSLGDRFGEGPLLTSALLCFGGCGLMVFAIENFAVLIAVRAIQGSAFGVVLALTISAVSRTSDPVELAKSQRVRMITMAGCEVALPILAGAVLGLAGWRWAYALQGLALPVGLLCWRWVNSRERTQHEGGTMTTALSALATPFGVAVQVPGFFRFFIKFAILTYFPILASDSFGMGPMMIGLTIGASASAATLTAAVAPSLMRRWQAGELICVGLVMCAAPISAAPWVGSVPFLVVLILLSGIGDGLLGVLNNVVAGLAAPADAKSAFLGATGSIRNLGKLVAPAIIGGLVAAIPLAAALSIVGGAALVAVASVPAIARGVRAVQER